MRVIYKLCAVLTELRFIKIAFLALLFFSYNTLFSQKAEIILGRPTSNGITVSVRVAVDYLIQIEYGLSKDNLEFKTADFLQVDGYPLEIELASLLVDKKYYYRISYRKNGTTIINKSDIYSFHTQRAKGSSFTFTLEADEHLYDKKGVRSLYDICLNNQLLDEPDFMMSLGDIFGDDHYPFTITEEEIKQLHENYRPILGQITHSIPFYVCLGNHEGEMDYYLNYKPADNIAYYSTLYRKLFYPNPFPNDFYSGNTQKEAFGIEYPENYFAWVWGDAQFFVLDVYRDQCDTSPKPGSWNWSLGQDQYNWFKSTLENSQSKFKLVFAHHVSGQGRGGILQAKYYEWGGYDRKSNNYVFPSKRPNMSKSIHELMRDNGVNIFFQGHDHVFAREAMDGVIYQTLPMPSDSTYQIGKLANADAFTSDTIGGSGHLRVSVNENCIKVDYVQVYLPKDTFLDNQKNRRTAFSYTIGDCGQLSYKKEVNKEFQLYPNPTDGHIYIDRTHSLSKYIVRVFDVSGCEIMTYEDVDHLDLSHLSNGIYLISIENDVYHENHKIIKNE